MSSHSNDLAERRNVSKVSFSPISSEVLCVKIRTVNTEVREEDVPKMSSAFRPIPKNPDDQKVKDNHSKSTMTDNRATSSTSSQTSRGEKTDSKVHVAHDSTPCIRHAAENIGRKAADIPSEKISMCKDCSKSMLSYIFLVQDFLDSLAKEISGNDTSQCLQCARQEVRNNIAMSGVKDGIQPNNERTSREHSESKSKDASDDRHSGRRSSRVKVHRQESKKNEGQPKGSVPSPQGHSNQQRQQMDFIYTVSPPSNTYQDGNAKNIQPSVGEKHIVHEQPNYENRNSDQPQNVENRQNFHHQAAGMDNQNVNQATSDSHQFINESSKGNETRQHEPAWHSHAGSTPQQQPDATRQQQTDGQSSTKSTFRTPMERTQPNYNPGTPLRPGDHYQNDPNNNPAQSPTLFRDDVDGIISTLSNVEREIYDSARDGAGWEGMTEPQERFGLPSSNVVVSEAFVTSCRNNAEAIGCLVCGTSLLLCRTTRTLCVLVSDGVSTAFRNALSSVFQVVQYVRSLDSLGSTKLALLEQPELGITFEKLNIWRLVQFTKCVYLNPDTLVIQNCDELFSREELSAVPDIGWPDCFNSGVFVYSPSIETFWKLLEFGGKQGSYDGGDQGLLNSYFTSWSSDISKKLSFIYNLMANVSYTYTPAFKHFGRDVKIVQFHGTFKPWHVKFFPSSGQISPSSPVHPTYVQFVHIWLSIFRISVLRLMSREIQSYADTQDTICAVEILRFFPLPSESEADFFLTPPSVRLRLTERKLMRSSSLPFSEARRRKSAEFFRYTDPDEDVPEDSTSHKAEEKGTEVGGEKKSEADTVGDQQAKEKLDESASNTDEVFEEGKTTKVEKVIDENTLPGAEVGDFQGMKAWEQGRMDYQGTDSSDNVIKRLQFLMSNPN